MVVVILGATLIVLSGYITGILFVFSFFGCVCNFKYFRKNSFINYFRARHVALMRLTFAFFLLHATLGILSRNFGINI